MDTAVRWMTAVLGAKVRVVAVQRNSAFASADGITGLRSVADVSVIARKCFSRGAHSTLADFAAVAYVSVGAWSSVGLRNIFASRRRIAGVGGADIAIVTVQRCAGLASIQRITRLCPITGVPVTTG